jgi:hypothetical protein
MAHDKLIAFLEQEAKILRNRIAGLKSRDILSGVTTGDGAPDRVEQMEADAEARLAEVEGHLRDLKSARDAA